MADFASAMLLSIVIVTVTCWIIGIPFVVKEIRKSQDIKLSDIAISCLLGGVGSFILFIEIDKFLDKVFFRKIHKLSLTIPDPIIFKKTGGAKQCK